jgi:hypothetical protein
VFQDPYLVKKYPEWAVRRVSDPDQNWKDRKGLGFIDVGARPYWDYVVELSRESHEIGFDEINYDYIRFPSDGNMKDALYTHSVGVPKAEKVEKFFAYLTTNVRAEYASRYKHVDQHGAKHSLVLSADLFGMTATNYDDLTIGQILERALPYFDAVAPMVYPSHYPPGFNGYANPNKNVYGVIKYSMDKAVARAESTRSPITALTHVPLYEIVDKKTTKEVLSQNGERREEVVTSTERVRKEGWYEKKSYPRTNLRTWIQDFDYGGDYGPKEVRAQIQATYDAGLTSWMIWSPSNRYTIEALHKD